MRDIAIGVILGAILLYAIVSSLLGERRVRRDTERILREEGIDGLRRVAERQRFHDKYGY